MRQTCMQAKQVKGTDETHTHASPGFLSSLVAWDLSHLGLDQPSQHGCPLGAGACSSTAWEQEGKWMAWCKLRGIDGCIGRLHWGVGVRHWSAGLED